MVGTCKTVLPHNSKCDPGQTMTFFAAEIEFWKFARVGVVQALTLPKYYMQCSLTLAFIAPSAAMILPCALFGLACAGTVPFSCL